MALTAGTRLGPYEIQSALGAGGMGEVFRAKDTRLGREVAVKVVPELFATDPDRVARFAREAQVLASLNHPNIAAIYGFEESDSTKALVLELVEGPTLADRLAQGAIPLEEALPIARQLVDALEAAHENGIIHRDLKPANIKLRPDGAVKVLDFGLAKALDPASSPTVDATNSPTLTARATQLGVILGTAAYMAPEQAKGKAVDKRADIWAFGCVLYEMLTGRRAFEGEDISDTLAFVITKEPDWSAVPPAVPAPIRRLLRRCLEKDRKRRLADIADARLEIDDASSASADSYESSTGYTQSSGVWRILPWAAAGILAVTVAAMLALWVPWQVSLSTPVRLVIDHGTDARLVTGGDRGGGGPGAVLSPDGRMLAFTARESSAKTSTLYVRRLDQLTASPLQGTSGAGTPFFSPDGQWIAFFADGRLKKIPVTGGAAVTLADAPNPRGGSWGDNGTIVFTPDRLWPGLLGVSSSGGKPEQVTTLGQDEAVQRWPQVLPGGDAVLYTSHVSASGFDNANLVVQRIPNGERKVVLRAGYHGRYARSGHLLYIRDGTLFAVPFDLDGLETTGPPVPAVEEVGGATLSGGAQFTLSDHGTLAYVPGREGRSGSPISWIDQKGRMTPLVATPTYTTNLHFSPDGQRIAFDVYDDRQWDVWVYDWRRDTLSRVTFGDGNELKPVWTPDGRRIVFSSTRADKVTPNLYWQRADGTGEVQRLTTSRDPHRPGSWHPSGRFLAFGVRNSQTSWDLMILPMEGDETSGWKPGAPATFLSTPFAEFEPSFSRDGRWLAYQSNESGRDEVYVRPFPGPGGKWVISTGGGAHAKWSSIRDELFYLANDRLMVVPYSVTAGALRPEKPRPWSDAIFNPRGGGPTESRAFDLHPDGVRFALAAAGGTGQRAEPNHVVLVFNFFDELRRIAPPAKR